MSVSYAPAKLKVPPGFEHLLEGLTREILKVQPKDIVAFSAEYFRKKLVLRDDGGISTQPEPDQEKPRHAAVGPGALSTPTEEAGHPGSEGSVPHHEDEEIEQVKLDVDVSDPTLNNAATVIQSTFRGHLAREKVKDLKVTERSPMAVTAKAGGELKGGKEEGRSSDTGTEEEDKSEVPETHESGEVDEGGEDSDGSGDDGENKAKGGEEGEEAEEDTSGVELRVEPTSEDVATDLPSGEEPVKDGEGGSLSGEQEEQTEEQHTEEHSPEGEEQEPSPEVTEGDAKASSNTELEGEGEEKLEPIAASTDDTQEMSND